jgi:hypothetical protein
VGIGKRHAHRGQSIKIRSSGLWVASEVSDPVIEVIDGYEQYIQPFLSSSGGRRTEQHQQCAKDRQDVSHISLAFAVFGMHSV